MSEWKKYRLGDVAEIVGGGTPSTKVNDYWNGDIPWLTPRDLSNFKGKYISKGGRTISKSGLLNSNARLLPAGTVLLSTRAPVGYIAIAKNELATNQGFKNLIPSKNTTTDFLYYLLKCNVEYLKSQATGTTFGELSGSTLKLLTFNFPPLPEQTAIAEVLSSLDDKIDLLHRQNKTLEQLAETLFRQWFVEEAEESWEVGTLEDEFEFVMGQSPSGDTLNENKVGMIFFQGRSDFGFRFPEPRVYTTSPTRIAKPLDTLISVRAPVGDINMAFEECCLGRGVAAFRYKHNSAFYTYTYYKLKSLTEQIKQFEDSGTVFGSIGKDDFKKLECVIPPNVLILKFQDNVKPLDDKIKSNTQQIRTLTQLRDTLLPKLMSGEVRVSEL
ncbi:MAG: restriction endonuclease subunit S [Cytophagales bacterium]